MNAKVDRAASRRAFLGTATAAVVVGACGTDGQTETTDDDDGGSTNVGGGPGSGGSVATGGSGGSGGDPLPLECTVTADNLLGPFYRAGAPFRDDLTEPTTVGTRVTVRGRVFGPDCQLLAGALIDVWQADISGDYDNDGVNDPPPDTYILRGKLNSDDEAKYAFRTIIPGSYLNGNQYRPAHIHVTVSAAGYLPLTTQLYFEADPYNEIDPFIIESLIMSLTTAANGELEAKFDFVLVPE
jgi:protocatechuate 3,4-dioxygenase beta subunit